MGGCSGGSEWAGRGPVSDEAKEGKCGRKQNKTLLASGSSQEEDGEGIILKTGDVDAAASGGRGTGMDDIELRNTTISFPPSTKESTHSSIFSCYLKAPKK